MWGNKSSKHFSLAEKEPISAIAKTVELDVPSLEPVQASDLILRSNT
jgi:hypothetical protein